MDLADPLAPAQLAELEADLTRLAAELEADVARGREGTRPVELDSAIGRVSRIDAIQQQQMAKAAAQRSADRLQRVRGALHRLAEDAYGDCLECDDPIGFRRLKAQPEALLCVDCQSCREV